MKRIVWDTEKAAKLKGNPNRPVTFEQCAVAIENDQILADIENPSRLGQRLFILQIDGYAQAVPYVEDDEAIYLKTIYPSRKYQKLISK